jgi:hypothetical protein
VGDMHDKTEWSMSDEREFMENLLCQRFNFFLVLFSLFLAAATGCQNQETALLVLASGTVVCVMVWLTIYRAHLKHHWIMNAKIYVGDHPANVVNRAMKLKPGGKSLFSVSRWMGVYIPITCCGILATAAILVLFRVIKIADKVGCGTACCLHG